MPKRLPYYAALVAEGVMNLAHPLAHAACVGVKKYPQALAAAAAIA